MYILYILFAVVLFSLLIAIHELGHFVTAKLSGVKVNEFSMFMGPAIWQKQKGETLYSIRTIPFGGYCAMEGEDGDSDDPRSFAAAAWWKKIIILVAGAGMNFLAGFLMVLLLVASTSPSAMAVPTIESFTPGNAIEGTEGLHVGDTLYALDGYRIYNVDDFLSLASLNLRGEGYTHDVTVIRNGQKILLDDFNMEPKMLADAEGNEQLRYGMNMEVIDCGFGDVLRYSWGITMGYARTVRLSFAMLFKGQAKVSDVSGPVGIVKTIADVGAASASVADGLWNVVSFMALIAVNLAIMNLLPIPALDGGHVVTVCLTALIEAVTHKKLDPKYESYLHAAGMVLLLGLMALIFLKDIVQLFR